MSGKNNPSAKPRILAIVPYRVFPPVMGGQKGIAVFYRYLARMLHLSVITVSDSQPEESFQVYTQLGRSRLRYINPFLLVRVWRMARHEKATHLLFEHPYYAWMILLFRCFSSYTLILHAHNIECERFRSVGKKWWPLLKAYEGLAFRMTHIHWFKTNADRDYAITQFNIHTDSCTLIPYGTSIEKLPAPDTCQQARQQMLQAFGGDASTCILLFNGTLSYRPNAEALEFILSDIHPRLQAMGFNYRIVICGKDLPDYLQAWCVREAPAVYYAGLVDDIDLYFSACDVFLNPVQDGGGIKTKLVEALGFGKPSISTPNGAIGVDPATAGSRLCICPPLDGRAWCEQILQVFQTPPADDHQTYYQQYSWPHIARHAAESL